MKRFRIGTIIIFLLVIVIGVFVLTYFVGGLKQESYTSNNVEFTKEGFVSMLEQTTFDKQKKIATNSKYTLFFDESTSIATIVQNDSLITGENANDPANYTKKYSTGVNSESTNDQTLIIEYFDFETGKTSANRFNTVTNSAAYFNELEGKTERHFSLKYTDEGVQILYQIGQFNAGKAYLPKYISMEYFQKYIVGNTVFYRSTKTQSTIFDEETGEEIDCYVQEYTGNGQTISYDAAVYLEENALATVEPSPSPEDKDTFQTYKLTDIDFDKLKIGENINVSTSPVYMNPFISQPDYKTLTDIYQKNIVNDETVMSRGADRALSPLNLKEGFRILYLSSEFKSGSKVIVDENEEIIMTGGIHATDEDGYFMYDNEGNPVQSFMSLDMVDECNQEFSETANTSLAVFELCLEFKLTDDGLEATILGDSIKDGLGDKVEITNEEDEIFAHNYKISNIIILPRFTAVSDKDATGTTLVEKDVGMIVIPDGSGAVINFNNGKGYLNYSSYYKDIYGDDKTLVTKNQAEEQQTLLFPMYGFINNTKETGVLAIVDSGAAQTSIQADVPRENVTYNSANFLTTIRSNEVVYQSTNSIKGYDKWTNTYCDCDYKYIYMLLDEDELNYSGLANKYREYLIDKYGLEEQDTTTKNVTNLEVLGAYEEYALLMGIKYKRTNSLTTFAQAKEIVNELLDKGVSNININYKSWTKEAIDFEAGGPLKVATALGGRKDFEDLYEYFIDKSVKLYPELFVTTTTDYDYSYGNVKYTSKSAGINYATHYPYNLATLTQDKKLTPTHMVSPLFYKSETEDLLEKFEKISSDGIYASDLGNLKIGDYTKSREIFPEVAIQAQVDALKQMKETRGEVVLSAPFDYAFPYVTSITNVPVTTTLIGIVDYAIPFYQLVISGLFDYSLVSVNGANDNNKDYFLIKALESGANIQFVVSYTDPVVLLDTDYTYYYKAFYQEWKDTIISMNNIINNTNIHGGRLISHEMVSKNVYKVEYSNGVKLVINANIYKVTYNENNIAAYSYIVL